jgi:hypothetical protein
MILDAAIVQTISGVLRKVAAIVDKRNVLGRVGARKDNGRTESSSSSANGEDQTQEESPRVEKNKSIDGEEKKMALPDT